MKDSTRNLIRGFQSIRATYRQNGVALRLLLERYRKGITADELERRKTIGEVSMKHSYTLVYADTGRVVPGHTPNDWTDRWAAYENESFLMKGHKNLVHVLTSRIVDGVCLKPAKR